MATPHPSIPFPSSASASPNTRADQIIYKFFTKLVLCIADARVTGGPNASGSNDLSVSSESREAVAVGAAAVTGDGPGRSNRVPKVDKWFNLETPDQEVYKQPLSRYRTISVTFPPPSAPPPLHVSVILLIPTNAHAQGQVLVHRYHADSPGSSDPADAEQQPRLTRISSLPRAILLESHILTLAPNDIAPSASSSEVELPQVYKQSIALFRSLYTLLRTLPAWKLYQRLRRRGAGLGSLGMDVRVRIGPRGGEGQGIAGFDVPLAQDPEANATETFNFPSIPTPLGSLALRSTYRLHPTFTLESLESILSSHFLSPSASQPQASAQPYGPVRPPDADPLSDPTQFNFTPTLTSAMQRHQAPSYGSNSGSGSPSSVPGRPRTRTTSNQPNLQLPLTPSTGAVRGSGAGAGAAGGPNAYPRSPTTLPFPTGPNASPGRRPHRLPSLSSPLGQQFSPNPYPPGPPSPQSVASSPHAHVRTISLPPAPGSSVGSGSISSSPRYPPVPPSPRIRELDPPFAVPGRGARAGTGSTIGGRRESLLSNSGDRPPVPGAVPVTRKTSLNPISPFKSSALSNSPSSLRHSPLSTQSPSQFPPPSSSLPRQQQTLAPGASLSSSPRTPGFPPGASSGVGLAAGSPGSAGRRLELDRDRLYTHSPAPSEHQQQGYGHGHGQGGALAPPPPPTPKYASSFGYRYAGASSTTSSGAMGGGGGGGSGSGIASDGSASASAGRASGSAGRASGVGRSPLSTERKLTEETVVTESPRSNHVPLESSDDDLDAFVKAIDSHPPLRGGLDEGERAPRAQEQEYQHQHQQQHHRQHQQHQHSHPHSRETRQPTLSSRADIDEALRRLTASFHETLESGPRLGLGLGVGGASGNTNANASGRERGLSEPQNGLGLIEGGMGGLNLGGSGGGEGIGLGMGMGSGSGAGSGAATGYHSRARSSSTSLLGSSQRRSYDEVVGRLDLAEGTADPAVDVAKKYEAAWGERERDQWRRRR